MSSLQIRKSLVYSVGRKNNEEEASKPPAIDSNSTTDKSPNKTLPNQKLSSKISRKMKHDTTKKVEKENVVLLQTVKSKEKKENSGKVEKKRSSMKNEDIKSKSPSYTKKDGTWGMFSLNKCFAKYKDKR